MDNKENYNPTLSKTGCKQEVLMNNKSIIDQTKEVFSHVAWDTDIKELYREISRLYSAVLFVFLFNIGAIIFILLVVFKAVGKAP